MVNLGIILALLFSFTASAIEPSGVPSVQIGGYMSQVASMPNIQGNVFDSLTSTKTFTLWAGTLACSGNDVYPFRKNGDLYQVTSGKTARCSSIRYRVGSASGGFQLLSATATFANGATTASLTSPKYQFGAANNYGMSGPSSANAPTVEHLQYTFGSATWPGVQCADNTQLYQVYLVCNEVP